MNNPVCFIIKNTHSEGSISKEIQGNMIPIDVITTVFIFLKEAFVFERQQLFKYS